MKSATMHLFGEWFVGVEGWKIHRGPYHLLPSVVWVSMDDVQLNVRQGGVAIVFLNVGLQFHVKRWTRVMDDRGYQIDDTDMGLLLDELEQRHGWKTTPDAAKIRRFIEKKPWLRQIFANDGVNNVYACGVLSNLLKADQPLT